MIKLDRADTAAASEHATIWLAFELSKAEWKLGVLLPGSQKLSRYTIGGGDLAALTWRP
jgi:transposase